MERRYPDQLEVRLARVVVAGLGGAHMEGIATIIPAVDYVPDVGAGSATAEDRWPRRHGEDTPIPRTRRFQK